MDKGEYVMFQKYIRLAGVLVLAAAPMQVFAQADAGNPTLGAPLYRDNCASCHGADLQGQDNWQRPDENGVLPAPPHDQSGHTWHHDDGLLFDYIKLGGAKTLEKRGVAGFKSGMEGFEVALSDLEIWHILAYIKSTWPEQVQAVQKERTQNARPASD